jgi:hypothetical protein
MPGRSPDASEDAGDEMAAGNRRAQPVTAPDGERDSAAGRGGAEPAESGAGEPKGLPGAAPRANPNQETEEASLSVPRGGMPGPLRGSLASLERQNARLDDEGLERIEDEADLRARIADGLLVRLPVSRALIVNADLNENHRYCRPWTAQFLTDLARAHEAAFHRPLEVNSAVRTVEYQKRLMETNGNAAAAEGDIVSPHLTGATVDIAKDGLSRQEIAWMRRRLAGLEAAGKIDVEEEFRQACFHITVYKSYAPGRKASPGTTGRPGTRPTARRSGEPADASGAQGI